MSATRPAGPVQANSVEESAIDRRGQMTPASPESRTHRLRATWPVHRREVRLLAVGYAVLVGIWIGFGELITGPLQHSSLTRNDQRIAEWMVAHRTPTWNHVTVWGSALAETVTKVVVTFVLAMILLRVWKRWFEPMILLVSLTLEAAAFIVVTSVVGRSRPAVQRLEDSPVGSSFPSGHVAASMAYIAVAVIVFWHTRNRTVRVIAAVLVSVIPVIVALSRVYRGMHFFSDVTGGALLGGAAVWLTVRVLSGSPQGVEAIAAAHNAAESRRHLNASTQVNVEEPCRS